VGIHRPFFNFGGGDMLGTKIFYSIIGVTFGVSMAIVLNSVNAGYDLSDVLQEQVYAEKYTGEYQPVYEKDYQVYTYETICKGFYIVQDDGVTLTATGFGDLAEQYSYSTDTLKVDLQDKIASTTDEKIPVIDIASTTDIIPSI